MKTKALRFKLEEQRANPVREEISFESVDDFDTLKKGNQSTAFVLEAENLRFFREAPEFKSKVSDCGIQKDTWKLARSMLPKKKVPIIGKKKVPIIDGKYTVAARLRRAIESLLKKAVARQDDSIFFIGTKKALFNELWEQADPVATRARSTPRQTTTRGTLSGNLSARILLDMMPPSRVPEEFAAEYVGDSDDVKLVRHLTIKAAKSRVPVLILGESGTGKEIVARSIHRFSDRANRLFVSLNCSAIPRELLEMELFGCEANVIQKGYPLKIGLWEYAKDGTLFLDEVGDLSSDHQVKILRAIAEHRIRRVGGLTDIPVAARVISATNRDLFPMVQAGAYRMDLYYRLRGFLISTPALRDHRNDIPNIAQKLWTRIDRKNCRPLTDEVLRELRTYKWQGNVRELKVLLGSAMALFGGRDLRIEHIRALRLYEEQLGTNQRKGSAADVELEPHWMDRLRHLRRVEEFIQAFKQSLQLFLEGRRLHEKDANSIQLAFRNRRDELEAIWQSRPLLPAKAAQAVEDLRATLDPFQKLVDTDIKGAFKKRETLRSKFDRILQVILKEAGKILKEL